MTVDVDRLVAKFASALAPTMPGGAAEIPQRDSARLGVASVIAVTGSTYTITLDGVNNRVQVPALSAVTVGWVVWVLEQPPILLILGRVVT